MHFRIIIMSQRSHTQKVYTAWFHIYEIHEWVKHLWWCCSPAKPCLNLCNPINSSTPGFTVLHHLLEFAQTHELMTPSNYFFLYRPLLLLPSIFPSITVFSSESALCVRWPKYWSFRFSISLFNSIEGYFPLGLTCLISLLSRRLSRVFSNQKFKNNNNK